MLCEHNTNALKHFILYQSLSNSLQSSKNSDVDVIGHNVKSEPWTQS